MYESFHIANLFYDMNETPKHSKDPVFYIISTSWFNRWKKYVNFDYYMSNTDKYLKLNTLPERPNSESPSDNYIKNLDEKIRHELDKYFDNFFLNDNAECYPGVVSNKELIYDKMTHYVNFDRPESSMNYNMLDNLENGNDYFIVTREIWKYFKAVYGGKEIKRYRVVSSASKPLPNEILIESKLKTINMIIIKQKTDDSSTNNHDNKNINDSSFPYTVEKPKFIFISRKATLYDFKKQVIEMFSFLKHIKEKNIRFWVLEPKYSYDEFVDFLNEKYNKKSNPRVTIPALSLELFSSKVKFEELEEIISNKLMVMEFIDTNKTHFPFKSQHLSDFSKEFQGDIIAISKGNRKSSNEAINYYDHLTFNLNVVQENTLFYIKKFFKTKYMLNSITKIPNNELNSVLLRICDISNENDRIEFNKEISCLRENMDLIFDKSDLLLKLGYAYSNNLEIINKNNHKKPYNGTGETKLRQDLILKKRERTKILEQLTGKHKKEKEQITQSKKEENKKIEHIDLTEEKEEEDKEEEKCTYCGKTIEEDEFIMCNKCNNAKYCNNYCMNKDLRFHIKNCNNIIKDNNISGDNI